MSLVFGSGILFIGTMDAAYDAGREIRDAAAKGCNDQLRKLLRVRSEFVNSPDEDGYTPLLHAVNAGGDEHTIDVLVRAGARVDAPEKHFRATPLIVAAALGKVKIVKALLDAKASVNRKQVEGATALHAAVLAHSEEAVSLLINAKAGVDMHTKCFLITPLMFAVDQGYKVIAQQLLDARASVDLQQLEGGTALRIAVQKQDRDMVALLLKAKAGVDQPDITGRTCLMAAQENGNAEIEELLCAALNDVVA